MVTDRNLRNPLRRWCNFKVGSQRGAGKFRSGSALDAFSEVLARTTKHKAEVIGLYLHPPQHAAVFCVHEKTAIQALDRKDPVPPLSPGRAGRHGFEYFRHGTAVAVRSLHHQAGQRIPGRTSNGPHALHADLFVPAQSGGAVIRQDRARRDRKRGFHFAERPQAQAHALHPPVHQATEVGEVEVLRSDSAHCFRFKCHGPPASTMQR